MEGEGFLFSAFVYLLAAVISVPIAKRLGLGSVLGYLIAGIAIGPYVFGFLGKDTKEVMHFAEFGVVMMLFLVGLELKPSLLWKLRKPIVGLGGLQVVITSIMIAAVATYFIKDWRISLAIGLTLALSSTAIILQTLTEKGLMKTEAGESSFSVLLFQDIAIIPMLALMPLLAVTQPVVTDSHGSSGFQTMAGWQQALMVVAIMVGIVAVGRFFARYIFRFIAETKLRDVFTAFALLIVIGIALLMQMVGLSPALGTFLAGVVLAESEYRHELESNIEPFKGLLLGLFFISVGAIINFNLLFSEAVLITALVLSIMALKFVVLFALGRAFNLRLRDNLLFSFALAEGGEFAFVLFAFATQNNVIPAAYTDTLILVVAISMFVAPILLILNEKLISPLIKTREPEKKHDIIDEQNSVIIAGFGRFGQITGRLLHANKIGTTVLDHKPGQIEMLRKFGYKIFYGDASRIELLHSAGAADAKLFVLAIDDKEKALEVAETVTKHFPNLTILARSFDRRHTYELMKRGVKIIRRETFSSALELGAEALVLLGHRAYEAHRKSLVFKHHDEKTLSALYEMWDDEKSFILHTKERNDDLINLLSSDQVEMEYSVDTAWERPGTVQR